MSDSKRQAAFAVIEVGADGAQRYAVLAVVRKPTNSAVICDGSLIRLQLEETDSEFFRSGRVITAEFRSADPANEPLDPPDRPALDVPEVEDGAAVEDSAAAAVDHRRAEKQAAKIAGKIERRAEDQDAALEKAFVEGTLPEADRREGEGDETPVA